MLLLSELSELSLPLLFSVSATETASDPSEAEALSSVAPELVVVELSLLFELSELSELSLLSELFELSELLLLSELSELLELSLVSVAVEALLPSFAIAEPPSVVLPVLVAVAVCDSAESAVLVGFASAA
ncbi:MAG: hypothetical protein AMXMBFR8_09050 [Nevskiales bacterium]